MAGKASRSFFFLKTTHAFVASQVGLGWVGMGWVGGFSTPRPIFVAVLVVVLLQQQPGTLRSATCDRQAMAMPMPMARRCRSILCCRRVMMLMMLSRERGVGS